MFKPRERELVLSMPAIEWTEPLPTQTLDGKSGLACRFCIAIVGLKGRDVSKLPQTREEFDRHMKEHSMAQ